MAGICILSAIALSVGKAIYGEGDALRHDADKKVLAIQSARPAMRSARGKQATEQERQAAMASLLEAVAYTKAENQRVWWSGQNFRRCLGYLNSEDMASLLEKVLAMKDNGVLAAEVVSVSSDPSWHPKWTISRSLKLHVATGLVREMAARDFVATVRWLDTWSSEVKAGTKGRELSRAMYECALVEGAKQAPREAWRVYKEKCPPWFG